MIAATPQRQRRAPPMGDYERQLVETARRRGASWDAVAQMLGRPTPDVRRMFDPTYDASVVPLVFASAARAPRRPREPAPPPPTNRPRRDFSGRRRALIRALNSAEPVSMDAIIAAVSAEEGVELARGTVVEAMSELRRLLPPGVSLICDTGRGWRLQGDAAVIAGLTA